MKEIPSISTLLEKYSKELPRKEINGKMVFDFDHSPTTLFVACFVTHQDKVLLLKRSQEVATNKGKWHVIAGYYDEVVPVKDKVMEELGEEAGLKESDIHLFQVNQLLEIPLPSGQTWYVVPVQIELSGEIVPTINWESTEHKWVTKDEASKLDLVPGVLSMLNQILK
jgi:ADP-ribose pyrophosphatase YjhB (NUDIX family)